MVIGMSLKGLHLLSVIDMSSAGTAVDFYVPALAVSVRYDRGVGFFSSGWNAINPLFLQVALS
jgi:hypothetical protein